MSRITEIASELLNDPVAIGYAALITQAGTDADHIHKDPAQQTICQNIADAMNNANRTVPRNSVTKSEILNAINDNDLNLINSQISVVFQLNNIDPNDPKIISIFTNVFSNTNGTLTALQTLQNKNVSRGEEMGWGRIEAGDIAMARVINLS